MTDKENCAACKASTRRPVDIFFDGYIAGFQTAVATANPELKMPCPEFCLEHDKLVTERHAQALKELLHR